MTLSWALIGIIVGLLLGITGAGGAIVAVPLFIFLADASLRDATVLSLIAVMAGASLNWLVQKENTNYRIGVLLFVFSAVGSVLFRGIKAASPDWVITALFIGVGLASLASVWKKDSGKEAAHSRSTNAKMGLIFKGSLGGFALGGLVTMTGLGGGVVIMPYLKAAFSMPLSEAAATSLLTILLSSLFTLGLQRDLIAPHLDPAPIIALVVGSLLSALATRQLIKHVHQQRLNIVRKFLITAVILMSAGSLLFKP